MELNTTLDCSITLVEPLKYEVYSFIMIIENYFELCPIITDRIKYVITETWVNSTMFSGLRFENVVIGTMLFVIDEFDNRTNTDIPPTDVTTFVQQLYGQKNAEYNLIQIYSVYQNLPDMFLY